MLPISAFVSLLISASVAVAQTCTSGTWSCVGNNLSICSNEAWATIQSCSSRQSCRLAPYYDCGGSGTNQPSVTSATVTKTKTTITTAAGSVTTKLLSITTSLSIPSDACPTGAKVSILSQPQTSLQARVGTAYGNVLYDPSNTSSNSYMPALLKVRVVDANGATLSGCKVSWTTSAYGGWAFPMSDVTDTSGVASAYWVAGKSTSQSLTASVTTGNGVVSTAQFQGSAQGHNTRANSVHLNWRTSDFASFSVDVTPKAWPPTTYCGIQNDRILFSMWQYGGRNPEVISKHPQTTCSDFGGEGTGIQCRIMMTPKLNVKYTFRMDVAKVVAGKQDYTVTVTDGSTGTSYAIATFRYGTVHTNYGAYAFNENFGDNSMKSSCLDTEVRTAEYSNVKFIPVGSSSWVDVAKSSASSTAVFTPTHNEACVNYEFSHSSGTYSMSTGGPNVVRPLNLPGQIKVFSY
ncbi:hypothetical protein BDR26DRAFT_861699 [Obelidium mucronatum]|nr:hypothetical protein BDR26DRAFT_861699 [Obelidium mucronatum]